MFKIKTLFLALSFVLIIPPSFGQITLCRNCYVWEFSNSGGERNQTTRQLTNNVEDILSQISQCTVLVRRHYDQLLEHVKNESKIQSLETVSVQIKSKLKNIKARIVIFGTVDRDFQGNVSLRLSFQSLETTQVKSNTVILNNVDFHNFKKRKQKLEEFIGSFIDPKIPLEHDINTENNPKNRIDLSEKKNDSRKFTVEIGAEGWHAKLKFQEAGEPIRNYSGFLIGPIVYGSIWLNRLESKSLNLNIQGLFGNLKRSDNEAERRIRNTDGLLFYRHSFSKATDFHLSFGGGWRFWYEDIITKSNNSSKDTSGPMFYVGARSQFGKTKFGWNGNVRWLFAEIDSGNDENKNDVHADFNIGIYYSINELYFMMGWRHRTFYERDDDRMTSGIILSLKYSI